MRLPLLALLMLIVIAGCARKEESAAVAQSVSAQEAVNSPSRYMAYEHAIHLDAEEGKVATVYKAALAACREAIADQCVILGSHLNTGREVSAELKFRGRPGGIRKLIAALGAQGEVISQSVTAEDLTRPIEDSAKKLAMLNDYRSKLEALSGRANNDIDALIKVNKELAQVQSEIEAMTGERTYLVQRIETEILNVSITTVHNRLFWKPVSTALSDFGLNLSEGLSKAITGVAFLIPWSLVLVVFVWVGRKLWLHRRTPKKNA